MVKMKSLIAIAALLAAGPSFGQQALRGNVKDQISQVQEAIQRTGAKWVAGETSVSANPANWKYYVGLNFQPMKAPPISLSRSGKLPSSLDWRNHGGDFVTPARDQGQCGSCWAFAMTGGLEAYVLRTQNMPGQDLDLSEQVMLSCSGAGSCQGGQLDGSFIKSTGLPPESDYPYTATDGNCSDATPGWQNEAYKVGDWGSINQSVNDLKAALNQYGPLPTAMMVYEDFMHYKSGVYSYTSGKKLGGHGILLVGYNDKGQYFIVKNSWSPNWGENGFFRISYSEVGSDHTDFGLSTVAYSDGGSKAPSALAQSEKTWQRVAPMFDGAKAWK